MRLVSGSRPAGRGDCGAQRSGQTTLASLLVRFYDPGADRSVSTERTCATLKVEWLRQKVSVVLQDPSCFSGTIRDNIAIGRPGAAPEKSRPPRSRAQIDRDIENFPQGYDTQLGERGVNLSGGSGNACR